MILKKTYKDIEDHCTLWFEGTWSNCCAKHDRRYANKRLTKFQADILLYRCVKKKAPWMAPIMFVGVSLLGWYSYYVKG